MIFERFICKPGNSTRIILRNCSMKHVDRIGSDRISFHMEANIIEPIKEMHVHFTGYKKYQVYKMYPVDVWEDVCAWLDEKKRSFFMEWTLKRIWKYIHYNGDLKCPLKGNLTINFQNVSLNEQFPMIPLLPSGRYRTDNTFIDGNHNTTIAFAQFYFAISDTRVEQYK